MKRLGWALRMCAVLLSALLTASYAGSAALFPLSFSPHSVTAAITPRLIDAVAAPDRETIARAAADYATQLNAVLNGNERRPIQPVYLAGERAADLLQVPTVPGTPSFLESHNNAELAPLLTKLGGFHRTGEEGQNLLPDWDFFRQLAEQKGMPEDREFFAIMETTVDRNGFPSYVEQATDYSGCTKYGSNILVSLYGRWRQFRQKFPTAYTAQVQRQLQDIASEFTDRNCACGQKDSVVAELESFLKSHPDDPLIPKVRQRLDEVRAGRAGFRYQCTPQ